MTVRILVGDCIEQLAALPANSVHACVTSPPYFNLRSYLPDGHPDKAKEIGLELTPSEFVEAMVRVFREVRRVLRDDGSLWIVIGDSYAASGMGGNPQHSPFQKQSTNTGSLTRGGRRAAPGLKPKDLVGIPWRVAFALQADGWWLRGDQIWAKANGMPESTKDRPSRAHEYVFMLTKSEQYYYGYDDVRLPPVPESIERLGRAMRAKLVEGGMVLSGGGYAPPGQPPHAGARLEGTPHGRHALGENVPAKQRRTDKQRGHTRRHAGFNDRWDAKDKAEQQAQGAALRSVWWIAPAGYQESHFAVMPNELAATCILAGCPAGGTVLDPFGGAGTTGLVADRLGRNAILLELNPEYAEMARRRIATDAGLFSQTEVA